MVSDMPALLFGPYSGGQQPNSADVCQPMLVASVHGMHMKHNCDSVPLKGYPTEYGACILVKYKHMMATLTALMSYLVTLLRSEHYRR